MPVAVAAEASKPDFTVIDKHVTAIARPSSGNIVEFVSRLVEPARSDLERARAIAWWLAVHIKYDHDMHRDGLAKQKAGRPPLEAIAANQPPEVMRRGKAVCSGYAAVFVACCKTIGIEAVSVRGGTRYNDEGHEWNAVSIDGVWRLLDISYMASGVGNASPDAGPIDFYFMPPPERLVLSHFPEDQKWQLLAKPVSRRDFDAVPPVPIPLLAMIEDPLQLRQAANRGVKEFVSTAFTKQPDVVLMQLPVERQLRSGHTYRFRIRAVGCQAVHINDGGAIQQLDKRGDVFQGDVAPRGPALRVGVQGRGEAAMIDGVLDYEVSTERPPNGRAAIEDDVARLINDVRRRTGVRPLSRDATIDKTAVTHAELMARQGTTPPRESCLVAVVDTPKSDREGELAQQFVDSMMQDERRRSWACAAMHERFGIGLVQQDGRTYFCIEFR